MEKENEMKEGEEVFETKESTNPEIEVVSEEGVRPEQRIKRILGTKTALVIAILLVLLAVLYSARGLFVAAMVNGSPISRFAVVGELEKSSGKEVLETLITQELIKAEIARAGVSVTEAEVDEGIAALREEIAGQTTATLEEMLEERGLAMEEVREQVLLQKQVEKLLGAKVDVTDEEVSEYLAQAKLEIAEADLPAAQAEIAKQMREQKIAVEAGALVGELRENANISYFVNY